MIPSRQCFRQCRSLLKTNGFVEEMFRSIGNSGYEKIPKQPPSDDKTYEQVECQTSVDKLVELPETPNPDLCCRSGCDNCIWIQYALKLDQFCAGQGEQCLKELDRQIDDPSIRAYIRLQIRQQLAEKEANQANKTVSD